MKIAIGSDHVGLELKPVIINFLEKLEYEVKDFGTYSDTRTDYPIFSKKVSEEVANGECDLGILICGTGVGVSITANKVKNIRAVVCSEPYSAKLSKEHNNTNILSLGSKVVGPELAKMIVYEWLNATYEGGRHQRRIDIISEFENDSKS